MIGEYWGSGTVASEQKAWVKDIVAYDVMPLTPYYGSASFGIGLANI